MTQRVTLITGASAGIGTELARVFAANGHRLALVARRADRLEALAAEITAAGGPAPIVIPCDLVQPDSGADHATVSSADGQYRASIPLEWLVKGRMQDGRLRIPAAPTKCWMVKDVVSIELTEGSRPDSVRPESFTTCVPES